MQPLQNKQTLPEKVSHLKYHLIAKRMFDIVFSLLVILFIFPIIFPIVFILILIEGKGSIFFIQKRNGLNAKIFNCIKFRTMVVNKYSDTKAAVNNDERITKVGKFLRDTSIDELPQFINVLKGDMSVVGPRPHMISDNERFAQIANNYELRHLAKPGITGLAQINGYKGHISTVQDVKARTIIDLKYVANQSFWLDFRIIWSTVILIFSDIWGYIQNKRRERKIPNVESSEMDK